MLEAPVLNHNHKATPDVALPRTVHDDLHRLETVAVPIITISATFRKDIAEHLGEKTRSLEEAVFSRAHFSMALGIFEQARRMGLTSWLVDPTNYVSEKDWGKILFTERIAETVARSPVLKKIKDIVDTFARNKLPISQAVKEPLKYVSSGVQNPIISFHYESGNLLAAGGKRVLQVVTDPHVRINYLFEAGRKNITFAVFDEETQEDFIAKARKMGKDIDADRVVVTGPPVDPRIVDAREKKRKRKKEDAPLKLTVATGGLGTNKGEIKKVLNSLSPEIKNGKVQVILYAGTHYDFKFFYQKFARENGIKEGKLENKEAPLRVIYDQSIIQANQALIDYAFPWADGFVTKPSGDMAYDAAAAGCFILSLRPWGEWEENIQKVFFEKDILQKAILPSFADQLLRLRDSGWIKSAIENALEIEPLFLQGAKKIVDLQQRLALK